MKKLLLITLCLLLLTALAQAEVKKTEVVYARLDLKGQVEGVYIVNGFETAEAAEVSDYGAYDKLINLGGTDSLSATDGALTLKLKPGRTYYQGDAEGLSLPWDIAFTYQLDGKEVAPEALSGASGQLQMDLKITASEALMDYAKALTLQITLTLDGERCLNIVAPKGTLASAGGNKTLAFVVLPGQSVNYGFTADVTDFKMAAPQIAGVRMVMDVEQYQKVAEEAMAGSPLAQAAGPLLQNFLGSMQGGAPKSFADSRNGTIDSLQFVLMGSEIPEKPAPASETVAQEAEPQGILARLMALFGL